MSILGGLGERRCSVLLLTASVMIVMVRVEDNCIIVALLLFGAFGRAGLVRGLDTRRSGMVLLRDAMMVTLSVMTLRSLRFDMLLLLN